MISESSSHGFHDAPRALSEEEEEASAQYERGIRLYKGIDGAPHDVHEAARLWRVAADRGHVEATVELALCHFVGTGVEKDDAECVRLLTVAAERGHVGAMMRLAKRCAEAKQTADAVRWYTAAVAAGKTAALVKLALLQSDEREAVRLLLSAIEEKHFFAAWFLGDHYDRVAGDVGEAARWFRVAAEHGVENSFHRLSRLRFTNSGQVEEALGWYREQAARGSFEAMLELAQLYSHRGSPFLPPDDLVAAKWYRRALDAAPDPRYLDPEVDGFARLAKSTSDLRVLHALGGIQRCTAKESTMVKARRVYRESTERARRAALCWMWTGLLLPQRDAMLIVARYVYDSRCDPAIWGVLFETASSKRKL